MIFGSNAILAFALANMINPIFGLLKLPWNGVKSTIPEIVTGTFSHLLNPWNASLAYALLFVALNGLIVWPLYRRRIFLRL